MAIAKENLKKPKWIFDAIFLKIGSTAPTLFERL